MGQFSNYFRIARQRVTGGLGLWRHWLNAPVLVSVGLAAGVVFESVVLVNHLWPPSASNVTTTGALAITTEGHRNPDPVDTLSSLFGQPPATPQPVIATPLSPELGLTLEGILFASDPTLSRALIHVDDATEVVAVGDELGQALRVHAIEKTLVILTGTGGQQVLEFKAFESISPEQLFSSAHDGQTDQGQVHYTLPRSAVVVNLPLATSGQSKVERLKQFRAELIAATQ